MLGNRALTLKKDLLKPGMQAKLGVEPGYWNPFSNLVGVVGNHEFDKGKDELLRRLYGGNFIAPANSNATSGPFLENPWKGANYPPWPPKSWLRTPASTSCPHMSLKW